MHKNSKNFLAAGASPCFKNLIAAFPDLWIWGKGTKRGKGKSKGKKKTKKKRGKKEKEIKKGGRGIDD